MKLFARIASLLGGSRNAQPGPEALEPDAHEERFLCILHSQIRGATSARWLDRYHERAAAIVAKWDGTVLTLAAGGVHAVFGAPTGLANPCQSAFDAANELVDLARALERERDHASGVPIDVAIGLHAGDAVLALVPGAKPRRYAVAGDVPRVSGGLMARAEGLGFRIVASELVVRELAMSLEAVRFGPLELPDHAPVEALGTDPLVDLDALPEATRLIIERNKNRRAAQARSW